jgi:hypothetical protein
VCVALVAVMLALSVLTTTGSRAHAAPIAPTERLTNSLLQFTVGGHALGFAREGVYIASADHALRVEFVDSAGAEPLTDAAAADTGRTQLLSQVTYTNVWQGIDVKYQAVNGGIVKSSYLVAAGADAGQIRLHYNAPVTLNADGSLTAKFSTGQITESAPIAWQEIDGTRVPVQVSFRVGESPIAVRDMPYAIRHTLSANRESPKSLVSNLQSLRSNQPSAISFTLGAYDRARPLVIDPTLLWNTFMGASNFDVGNGIAIDGSGNVYVAGWSENTWGSPVNAHAGGSEAFAAKLNSSGALVWNTFMGSSSYDEANSIAVDDSGNIYVAGFSYDTWGSPVNAHAGGEDAFAAKLNGSGTLVWNTFMGASGIDIGSGIIVDSSEHAYVVGSSAATWGSPVTPYADGGEVAFAARLDGSNMRHAEQPTTSTELSAFAAKLDGNGVLVWNTFMGSSGDDYGYSIAIASGNVYIVGNSNASWGSPLTPFADEWDVFVVKLNGSGALLWNTFLGSLSGDYGGDITVDGSENVYVVGNSNDTWGLPVNAYAGGSDAFAAKLNSSGALVWNTFMGSSADIDDDIITNVDSVKINNRPMQSNHDDGSGIAVDGSGNVYIVGTSGATWGSPVNGHAGGGYDAFAAKLNSSGARQWNTFVGSSDNDWGRDIAIDGSGSIYVVGYSIATWGSPVDDHVDSYDAFAAKLITTITATDLAAFTARVNAQQHVVVKWRTDNEMNLVGFNVYRATKKNGTYKRLNKALIAAKHPGEILGANYSRTNKKVNAGKTYFYKLELVRANGASEWSAVRRVTLP